MTKIDVGCAECGVNGGYALYCVACAEKFVGGYKDSGVPAVETGLEQVSPDTPPQHSCKFPLCQNEEYQQALAEQITQELYTGTPQRTWVGLTKDEQNFVYRDLHNATLRKDSFWVDFANAIQARLKEKNA